MSLIEKLNRLVLKFIKQDEFIQFQIIIGIFGIGFGIIAFFYYFLKISRLYSLVFILTIIIGVSLIKSGKKDILNGKVKSEPNPY